MGVPTGSMGSQPAPLTLTAAGPGRGHTGPLKKQKRAPPPDVAHRDPSTVSARRPARNKSGTAQRDGAEGLASKRLRCAHTIQNLVSVLGRYLQSFWARPTTKHRQNTGWLTPAAVGTGDSPGLKMFWSPFHVEFEVFDGNWSL